MTAEIERQGQLTLCRYAIVMASFDEREDEESMRTFHFQAPETANIGRL